MKTANYLTISGLECNIQRYAMYLKYPCVVREIINSKLEIILPFYLQPTKIQRRKINSMHNGAKMRVLVQNR